MKVVCWNVRGASSPHKKFFFWQTVFNKQWDVVCAVEHKCHDLSGSILHLRGYSTYYAGCLSFHYSGVVMVIRDTLCPQMVFNDPSERFMIMEITYFGEVVWVVGVYAPNDVSQRTELWSSLHRLLSVGRAGLMMGDFNMCVDASQSTSRFSLMNSSEQACWDQLALDVLKLDVWKWLHQDDPGFTFQSMQYRHTWSRLDRMYVMHDESFLPELLHVSVLQDVVSSDHFPLCFEINKRALEMYKILLDKVPLRFNSSLLVHMLFDTYMQQIFENFSNHVYSQGEQAWETALLNINYIHRMYGLTNAQRRRGFLGQCSDILVRCNSLLMKAPLDEELVDLQSQLHDIIKHF